MRDVVIDPWTPLDYKQVFGSGDHTSPFGPTNAPWLSKRDRRRLSAYLVLAAFAENAARHLHDSDPDDRNERREYGDPSLIIEQALTALLGETQDIAVEDAAGYNPEADPDDPDETDPAQDQADARQAWDMQRRLREWWDTENVNLTILDGERKALTLGDAVYLLWWDATKQRPRLSVIDPGFYFPVLPDGIIGDQYPTRVHFVWETPADEHPDGRARLHRQTYSLEPIRPAQDAVVDFLGREVAEPVLVDGDWWETTPNGGRRIARSVPWSDEPVYETCYLTEATWVLSDLGDVSGGVDALDLSKATFATRKTADGDVEVLRDLDLRIDFMPVVHIPNTVPGEEHFGQALLTKAAQTLDDLQSADTDAQAASATTGSPMIALSQVQTPMARDPRTGQMVPVAVTIEPGRVWQLGSDGRAYTIDTSAQLEQMGRYVDRLRARLTQNVRIPDVALGIVDEEQRSASGFALQLRYGPMEGLIRGLRLPRTAKYPILLRFVQRMFMLADEYDGPSRTFRADLLYGTFMPQDLAGTITRVREAYTAGIISLDTAVAMLAQAGVPIEDIAAEVRKIESRDYDKANQLADALGDPDAVREFLHLPPVRPAPGGLLVDTDDDGEPLPATP